MEQSLRSNQSADQQEIERLKSQIHKQSIEIGSLNFDITKHNEELKAQERRHQANIKDIIQEKDHAKTEQYKTEAAFNEFKKQVEREREERGRLSRDQLDIKQSQVEQLRKELYESQLVLQQMRDTQLTEVNNYKAALEKAEEEKKKVEERHNQALDQIIKDMNERV